MRAPATLPQALENVPGVSAVGEGQGAVPAIRGLARGRSLIMVDGSRVSTERRAGPNASFLDPSIVGSMEVARGPGSVAYGSDAFGGVIAVRTGVPRATRRLTRERVGYRRRRGSEARGDVEVSRGYGSGGMLVSVRASDVRRLHRPGRRGAEFGLARRGSSRALGARSRQPCLVRRVGRAISAATSDGRAAIAATLRDETPYEDSHRLTLSYEARTAGWFEHLRIAGALGSSNERTEQDRLATAKQPRNLTQATRRSATSSCASPAIACSAE